MTDDENQPIRQKDLQEYLDYLNGKISFGGISSRNTGRYVVKRQKELTKARGTASTTENKIARDKSFALATLNKTLMLQIQLANKLQEGRIAVIWVEFGTGGVSSTLRSETGLFNEIPTPFFQRSLEYFKPIQERFDLINQGEKGKTRYIQQLSEDASLNYLVFKARPGKYTTKRPSQFHRKWPNQISDHEFERYKCFSESIDINSNLANLIVCKNDMVFPVMDYLVPMQGSTHLTSHLNHVGNVNPNWFPRDVFSKVSNLT